MKKKLNEGLPAMVPTYPVNIAGQKLTLRFDTNINKTKKGIKLQFVLENVPEDPRQVQQLANSIGAELQTMFGDAGLQIVYDVENPYKNVVGFLLPLTSIADYLVKKVIKSAPAEAPKEQPGVAPEEEPKEELPAKPVAEGLLRPKLTDLFGYT